MNPYPSYRINSIELTQPIFQASHQSITSIKPSTSQSANEKSAHSIPHESTRCVKLSNDGRKFVMIASVVVQLCRPTSEGRRGGRTWGRVKEKKTQAKKGNGKHEKKQKNTGNAGGKRGGRGGTGTGQNKGKGGKRREKEGKEGEEHKERGEKLRDEEKKKKQEWK